MSTEVAAPSPIREPFGRGLIPLLGVPLSALILAVAAPRYPGGYAWLNQSLSSLFQPNALNGSPNGARPIAAAAVLVFCVSMAIVFHALSKVGPTRFHRKAIEVGGIGSMAYAALVVTPMHDLMVSVALLFFVTAMVTILHWLYVARRFTMLGTGVVCLAPAFTNATMYYGNVGYGFLPVVQKLAVVLWVGWLLVLYRRGRPAS